MQKMQILFPDPVMRRLRRIARMQDRPISEIVRRAVEDALKRIPDTAEREAPPSIPTVNAGKMLVAPESLRDILYRDRVG